MENQTTKSNSGADDMGHRDRLLVHARGMKPSPGVYLMKDEQGSVVYIGKAKSLRSRISSYFQTVPHEIPWTEIMVSRVRAFDVILTETESEALILECTLIKKHKPRFNIRLKDDKTYPYIKIRLDDPYPRIEWTRRVLRDQARYFGPFPSAFSARQVMNLLIETFRLRDCSDNTFRHRSRPCILFQMGKCSGSCVQKISESQYRDSIEQAVEILEGKTDRLVKILRKGMQDAAEHDEFEKAAEYRDQLRNLEIVTETQAVTEAGSHRDRDVVGLARQDADGHGTVLRIRGGRLVSVKHYHLQNLDPSFSDTDVFFDFLSQHYLAGRAKRAIIEPEAHSSDLGDLTDDRPTEVLLPVAPNEPDLLERTIGIGVRVSETAVDVRLLGVAHANAVYGLEQSRKKAAGHGIKALEEVQEKLHLPALPHRIECYDISNIHGDDAVASRVVFIDGAPDKNLYRRYKIRTVEGQNDFAMMKEVLGRRFSKAEERLPDLVVVDGGKGQLSQAVAILDELAVQGVSVVGLAKARVESDFTSSEVKSSRERVFIPNRKNPVPLLPHTDAYKLLTHIRDEAHRFAISYHRLLRGKRSLKTRD